MASTLVKLRTQVLSTCLNEANSLSNSQLQAIAEALDLSNQHFYERNFALRNAPAVEIAKKDQVKVNLLLNLLGNPVVVPTQVKQALENSLQKQYDRNKLDNSQQVGADNAKRPSFKNR